ncbi:hypothetical protein [Lentzea flaviverrucosa]|uniref:Capsular polysaccharide biosynthesis protein n=1 Tax=Lentzea flaviverrucosa TaxID=200379 RepID=A0A1H9W9F3_9PSEU|nr:hypothetical protein [Lentzea flaviverrucosa]RDI22291.1 hypothetical protein DFR72_112159 [Lentzea flaviverrucosa]SES30307.1 hypothetical protein SAMN05216195_111147 [Lentzea flaviverrucosa]
MDFWGTVRVLRRRWYIALPAVLLTGVLALSVYITVPTRYESSGVLVLTSPAAGGRYSEKTKPEDVVRVNPLLQFDGSLTTTAQILTQVLGDPKTAEELAGEGSTAVYTANTGPVGGPLLFVTTEADSAESAEGLVGKVLEKTVAELAAQQKALSAPEQTFITAQVLVKPTTASAKIGGKVRYVGAATVVLLLLTLASTFAADSILLKAKRRKDGKDGKDKDAKDPAPSEKDTTPAPVPPVRPNPPANGNGAGPARPVTPGVPNAHQKTVIIAAPKPPNPAWPTKDD